MAFFKVAGVDVPVLQGSFSGTLREVGERTQADDGTLRSSIRAEKNDCSFETPLLSFTDAYAWRRLLMGYGHVWTFEAGRGLYSSRGLGPSSSSGITVSSTAAFVKYGGFGLYVNPTSGTITYPASLGSTWTVMFWSKLNPTPNTWVHYVIRSDGAKWVDGVSNNAASTTFFSVSSGNMTLANVDASNGRVYDDVVAFPFLVLDAWPASFYAVHNARTWTETRKVELSGDMVPEASFRYALGLVDQSQPTKAFLSGSAVNAVSLSVSLQEV